MLRVVARVANDAADISAGRTRERFREIAQQWLDPREPGHFNQALMELGATVCLPRNPLCLVCPLAACCRRATGRHRRAAARETAQDRTRPARRRRCWWCAIAAASCCATRSDGQPHGRILGSALARRSARTPNSASASAKSATPSPTITTRSKCAAPRAALPDREGFRWFATRTTRGIPFSTTARKALRSGGNRLQLVIVS